MKKELMLLVILFNLFIVAIGQRKVIIDSVDAKNPLLTHSMYLNANDKYCITSSDSVTFYICTTSEYNKLNSDIAIYKELIKKYDAKDIIYKKYSIGLDSLAKYFNQNMTTDLKTFEANLLIKDSLLQVIDKSINNSISNLENTKKQIESAQNDIQSSVKNIDDAKKSIIDAEALIKRAASKNKTLEFIAIGAGAFILGILVTK